MENTSWLPSFSKKFVGGCLSGKENVVLPAGVGDDRDESRGEESRH